MIGRLKDQIALRKATPTRRMLNRLSGGQPYRTAKIYEHIIKRHPTIKPGIKPPINNLTTETFAMTPYIIMLRLGGIMMAMEDEEDVTAAEKARGYPCFSI